MKKGTYSGRSAEQLWRFWRPQDPWRAWRLPCARERTPYTWAAAHFSARASARNFSDEELRQAVRYCHGRGVKVYLALNTLLLDSELPEAIRAASFAASLPVDAIGAGSGAFASFETPFTLPAPSRLHPDEHPYSRRRPGFMGRRDAQSGSFPGNVPFGNERGFRGSAH